MIAASFSAVSVFANGGPEFACRFVVAADCENKHECDVLFDDEKGVKRAVFGKPAKELLVGDKIHVHGQWHTVSDYRPLTSSLKLWS